MKNKSNCNYFQNLLAIAIGNRSKKEFAEEVGLSREYLTRLAGGQLKPSVQTLKKIAEKASEPVTLKELMESCGYEASKSECLSLADKRQMDSDEERIRLNHQDILDGIKELISNYQIYDDINDLLDMFRLLYTVEDNKYSVTRINQSGSSKEDFVVTATWENNNIRNTTYYLLHAISTSDHKFLFSGISSNIEDLVKTKKLPPYVEDELERSGTGGYDFISITVIKNEMVSWKIPDNSEAPYEMSDGMAIENTIRFLHSVNAKLEDREMALCRIDSTSIAVAVKVLESWIK